MTTPTKNPLVEALTGLGFKPDEATQKYLEGLAEDAKMHDNGPYQVRAVYVKGDVTVTIEQNTAPDDLGDGMSAVVSHPPCGIIDGPNGYRVAFNPTDVNLFKTLVADLSTES